MRSVTARPAQLFVALAEEGVHDGPIADGVAHHYLDAMFPGPGYARARLHALSDAGGIDSRRRRPAVSIVDSAATTAKSVREQLRATRLAHVRRARLDPLPGHRRCRALRPRRQPLPRPRGARGRSRTNRSVEATRAASKAAAAAQHPRARHLLRSRPSRRRDRRDRQEFASAVRHGTASTTRKVRPSRSAPVSPGASIERPLGSKSLHAAFHAPAVVGARDHFLSGVAALVERDSADDVEVEHLRDEGFGGREHRPAECLARCRARAGARHRRSPGASARAQFHFGDAARTSRAAR